MNTQEERQRWREALHQRNLEQERLFKLIAGLTSCMDKSTIVETLESILDVKSVERDGSVMFDSLAVRFGADGRVTNLCRIIDGAGIMSDSDGSSGDEPVT